MDDAKLMQGAGLLPACLLLPGQVERLARVLPGLIAVSHQPTDLAEPGDQAGKSYQRARADTFADRLFQQCAPLSEAPLERRGIAQARCDPSQRVPFARGTTEGQALLPHPDGVLQVSLGEVQVAEVVVGNDRCVPSACQRGEVERLLPWRRPSAKAPSVLKVCASHARDSIRKSVLGVPDARSAASTFRRSSAAARPKAPMA
jgi:hypothetical protein